MRFSAAAACSLLLVLSTSGLAAQDKAPKRPKLPAGADTNSARTYYDFAIQKLKGDPEKAADALYWSTRLEPMWPDAYYARRVALLMSDPRRLEYYEGGDRRTIESKEVRAIDSLFYHALTINPFVSQVLDRELFETFADNLAREMGGDAGSGDARYWIDRQMQRAPAATRAWLAYGEGDFSRALELYAYAIKSDAKNGPLHAERGRLLFQMNQPDSALAELTFAIEDMRKRDKKDLIYVYQSKALLEHSIAVVHQRLGNNQAAKDAYGRALQEDLAYYPAHLQLAFMAIEAKDTTTALSEMDLAVQLRPDDAAARYLYGFTLLAATKVPEAEVQLRKSIELNSVYAAPRYLMALAAEQMGRSAEALALYRTFLSLASKVDLRRQEVDARIAALSSPATPPPDRR